VVQRIAINKSIGGFGISKKALFWLIEHGDERARWLWDLRAEDRAWSLKEFGVEEIGDWYNPIIPQDDSLLIQCQDELGKDAYPEGQELAIVEVPDGVEWEIDESEEGYQWVSEKHRT
jgi:hypothetical protein